MFITKILIQWVMVVISLLFVKDIYAEDWVFLDSTEGNMIGVRNISLERTGDFSGYYYVDILNGYLPNGRYEEGTLIGSRLRGVLMNCSSNIAFLLQDTKLDKKFNVVSEFVAKNRTNIEAINQNIRGDIALEKTRDYVCSGKSAPNKVSYLLCNLNKNDITNDITFTVDYTNKTVNGLPANLTDTLITFNVAGFPTFIDRYSGTLRIKTPEGEFLRIGSCSTRAEKQF